MKKIITEFIVEALLFFGIFFLTLQVDWMKLFHLSPTIVGDKLSELVWNITYDGLHEVKTDAVVEQESTSNAIRNSLDMLNEKERTIISMYFGLGTSREYSLEEIAMKLDISRERTRQLRDRALKRLKTEPNSPLYQMYMNQ